MRREKSFDGITYKSDVAPIDTTSYEAFSASMGAILDAEAMLRADPAYDAWLGELNQEGAGTAKDSGVGNQAVESATFSSLMHNIIAQFLLAQKATLAGERAIKAIEAGQKPILTVSGTNESFLKEFTEGAGIEQGDAVNASFGDVVRGYLERTRRITVKKPDDTTEHRMFPLSKASQATQDLYKTATAAAEEVGDVPVSPIDRMTSDIEAAGYKVGEITGRKLRLIYDGDDATLSSRPPGDIKTSGRKVTLEKFNSGDIDVMILNRAGSTGLSAHASAGFKDQRPRHMIVVQPEANIDTHMQMLGRVNRTGQVVLPEYTQLSADVPAEVRPAAVLAKKMASLSANTTADRKSAMGDETAVDFLNKYGDQIVSSLLRDNDDWRRKLLTPKQRAALAGTAGGVEDIARKATGRLVALPIGEQKRFLDTVTMQYGEMIEKA